MLISVMIFTARISYANECAEMKIKSATASKTGVSLSSFDWAKAATKQLILLGDEHSYSDPNIFIQIGENVKKTSKAEHLCLLLEMPSSIPLSDFKRILNTKSGDAGTDRYRRYYSRIITGFEKLGFSPIMVDDPKNMEIDESMEERNVYISKNILSLSKHTCEVSIMVVGKEHISPDRDVKNSLPGLLSRKLSLMTINPISVSSRVPIVDLASWTSLCPNEAFRPVTPIIFGNKPIWGYSIYPRHSAYIIYGNYDYTVLYP